MHRRSWTPPCCSCCTHSPGVADRLDPVGWPRPVQREPTEQCKWWRDAVEDQWMRRLFCWLLDRHLPCRSSARILVPNVDLRWWSFGAGRADTDATGGATQAFYSTQDKRSARTNLTEVLEKQTEPPTLLLLLLLRQHSAVSTLANTTAEVPNDWSH